MSGTSLASLRLGGPIYWTRSQPSLSKIQTRPDQHISHLAILSLYRKKMEPKDDPESHPLSPLSSSSSPSGLPTTNPAITTTNISALPPPPIPPYRRPLLLFHILLNTLSTIGIVFINHSLFTSPLLLHSQILYASYHFFLTYTLLTLLSSPSILSSSKFFTRKTTASWKTRVPLALAMGTQVVLPNLSNGYSSVMFYQVARILLTPTVAGMNFWWWGKRIPRRAAWALGLQCIGVGVLAWFDSRPQENQQQVSNVLPYQPSAADDLAVHMGGESSSSTIPSSAAGPRRVESTGPLGVFFSLAGVLASSLYTIWVAEYHKRWELSSMQLLHNQSWLGGVMLLYPAPFEISGFLKGRSIFGGIEGIGEGVVGGRQAWGILMVSVKSPHWRGPPNQFPRRGDSWANLDTPWYRYRQVSAHAASTSRNSSSSIKPVL